MRDPTDPGLRLKTGDRIVGDDGTVTCIALRDIRVTDALDLDDFEWVRPRPAPGGSIQREWGLRGHAGVIAGVRWISEAGAIAAGLP